MKIARFKYALGETLDNVENEFRLTPMDLLEKTKKQLFSLIEIYY